MARRADGEVVSLLPRAVERAQPGARVRRAQLPAGAHGGRSGPGLRQLHRPAALPAGPRRGHPGAAHPGAGHAGRAPLRGPGAGTRPAHDLVRAGAPRRRRGHPTRGGGTGRRPGRRHPSAVVEVVSGSRFLAHPRCLPDGRRLAWVAWDHPRMPWDGTELRVGQLDPTAPCGSGAPCSAASPSRCSSRSGTATSTCSPSPTGTAGGTSTGCPAAGGGADAAAPGRGGVRLLRCGSWD